MSSYNCFIPWPYHSWSFLHKMTQVHIQKNQICIKGFVRNFVVTFSMPWYWWSFNCTYHFEYSNPMPAAIHLFNSLRPRQNGCHFADDVFKRIFLNENAWISLKISLKFVPKVPTNNIPALIKIMAWRRPGDKPLSEPMMVNLLMHICGTRPQWVKLPCYKCYFNTFYAMTLEIL